MLTHSPTLAHLLEKLEYHRKQVILPEGVFELAPCSFGLFVLELI
jgi:hypothetical protein